MSTEKLYVVIKRGLFWRPEDKGYTAKIEEAGRYTKEEAESRCHGGEQPVTMALESEFQTTESIKAENSQLRTDLEAALKTASFRFDEWSKGQTELENSESRCAALAKECEELKDKLLSQEKRIGFQYAQKWNDVSHAIVQELSILYKDIQACESGRVPEQDSKQAELTRLHQAVAALKRVQDVFWPGGKMKLRDRIAAARADAARKEPPAKAHGCEVGE